MSLSLSLLTDGSFLCCHGNAQLLGGVGLSLLAQQRAQRAPQDEGDAAAGHHGVAGRLRGSAVGRQLHQQGQEGGEVGLQPGAAQRGDEDYAGLRRKMLINQVTLTHSLPRQLQLQRLVVNY